VPTAGVPVTLQGAVSALFALMVSLPVPVLVNWTLVETGTLVGWSVMVTVLGAVENPAFRPVPESENPMVPTSVVMVTMPLDAPAAVGE
jgi:hypothetical protein